LRKSNLLQFHQNIRREKNVVVIWSNEKRKRDDKTLKEVEKELASLYNNKGFHYFLEK
jgi:hypothetical protein